jgi:Glycosyl hydrolase family 3 N terminal domain
MSRAPTRRRTVLLVAAAAIARTATPVAVGDSLLLLPCGSDPTRQAFDVIGSGGGDLAYHVRVTGTASPALVLDISGPSKDAGTPLHVWGSYSPSVPNQQFQYAAATGLFTSLFAPAMCIGAADADPATGLPSLGAELQILVCNASAPAQRFAVSGTTISAAAAPGLCVQAANHTPTCADPVFRPMAYCNSSLPVEARVADLVSRMRAGEKAAALDSGVPAIPRLGVPSMASGEALHGAATGCLHSPAPNSTGCPTSFPAPVALGAAFDEALWAEVGLSIGTEARALYNLNAGSVWLFAPNINLVRDPKWGRAQEVPGEDPTLVSAYANAFVRGVQGQGGADPARLLAATTLKHWLAYDLEGYIPRTDPLPRPASALCDTPGGCQRWNFDALINDRDLHSYYAAPFVAAIEAGARSVSKYKTRNRTPARADF